MAGQVCGWHGDSLAIGCVRCFALRHNLKESELCLCVHSIQFTNQSFENCDWKEYNHTTHMVVV